jgi:3-O-methylgallate 3,4-dioxygenase
MAHLVLGVGSSHGPTLQTPAEDWARLGHGDQRDPRYDFQELLRNARPGLDAEVALERQQQRADSNASGLITLRDRLMEAELDVLVVVSNPHRQFDDDNHAVFGVFRGESLPVSERRGKRFDSDSRFRDRGERPQVDLKEYPGHPGLAKHLIESLIIENFDVAVTDQLRPGAALDEAFTLIYERFFPDGSMPMVPFMLSRYLPYQATPNRCYALGGALRRAIEAWDSDARVGLLASGGLSHQIIDEELDHRVIEAMVGGDKQVLCSLDRQRLNGAPGTPEILNWVTVAGAMEPTRMTLIDYNPCYRSLAGTGHGITFGYWR